MKITVLGSRDQLCIHPEVKSLENSSDKISVCREKVRQKTCLFHRNFESMGDHCIHPISILWISRC